MTKPIFSKLLVFACLFAIFVGTVGTSYAQDKPATTPQEESQEAKDENKKKKSRRRPRESRMVSVSKKARKFLELFKPATESASQATVIVHGGRGHRKRALGAIVESTTSAGYVLTKHSELISPITCELSDGRTVDAFVFGVHEATDLALLKLNISSLPTISWGTDRPVIGDWLASVSPKAVPIGVGIVGVNARLIKRARGFMGIRMNPLDGGVVEVLLVEANSPAEKAGVKNNDVIKMINDKRIVDMESVRKAVGDHAPGDTIHMTVRRGGREITLDITLGLESEINPALDRGNQQNTMGTGLSKRRDNFPLAIQHDIGLEPSQIGGPVVDIDGNVVGLNIARKGRVDSLMLPSSVIVPVIEELRSGILNPALINKSRIEAIHSHLEKIKTTLEISETGETSLGGELKELTKQEKSAQRNLEAAREELREVTRKKHRAEFEFEQSSDAHSTARRQQKQLNKELEKLLSGTK